MSEALKIAKAKAKKIVDEAKEKAKTRMDKAKAKAVEDVKKAKDKKVAKQKCKVTVDATKEKCKIVVEKAKDKAKKIVDKAKAKKGGNNNNNTIKVFSVDKLPNYSKTLKNLAIYGFNFIANNNVLKELEKVLTKMINLETLLLEPMLHINNFDDIELQQINAYVHTVLLGDTREPEDLYEYAEIEEDIVAFSISKSIKHMQKLKHLIIHDSNIGIDGMAALAEVLPSMESLQILDLSGNIIGDDGVAALAKVLPSMKHLTTLILNKNKIGETGFQSLQVIKTTYPSLDISYQGNDILS